MTEALLIPHREFCQGLPAGHFKVIVNPDRARKYVRHKLLIFPIALAVAGLGVALALAGYHAGGLGLVAVAVIVNRLISSQSAKLLLHLATHNEATYFEAMEYEILEVRRAA